VMQRPPVRTTDSIFAGGLVRHIAWVGALTGLIALTVGLLYWTSGSPHWQTMIFTTLCFLQVGQALAMRSNRESLFKIGLASNRLLLGMALAVVAAQLGAIYLPFMHGFMYTTPLPLTDLFVSIAASAMVFGAIEFDKWRSRQGNK
jgi:Ca2+-transporting ATPase